jgi:16S rRNA (adenine1518-N6/adenine1519-N6)-dimethyltransferase
MKYHQPTALLLEKLNASILKRYGQNFLVDERLIKEIMEIVSVNQNDRVMEIGPGLGALTKGLIAKTKQLTTFEIDQTFHQHLQSNFSEGTHLRMNFLKAKPQDVDWIIGNLPYYITTEIIEKIYKDFASSKHWVLMVQQEVWPRLIAQPSDDQYGPLAIFVATFGQASLKLRVPPEAYYPEPRVQSIVFTVDQYPQGPLVDTKPFFYFIKKLFLHRRKTILNNLIPLVKDKVVAQTMLSSASIDDNLRPEMVSVKQFITLFQHYQQEKPL